MEDAAAVVVDHEDPDRRLDVGQRRQPAEVVQEAEVAGDDRRRPAARRSRADPRGDQAVDPVGAAVAEEEGVRLAGAAGRPPGRGSACSRRCRRGRRPVRGAERAVQGRLGDRPSPSSSGSTPPARRARPRSTPRRSRGRRARRVPPSRRRARSGRRAAAPPRGGSARSSRPRGRRRSGRRPSCRSRPAAACWSASRRSAGRGRGACARRSLVAEQQVVGGDDVRAVVGPAAQLRGRLGEDREAGGLGQVGERLAQLGVELAAGDDHPDPAASMCFATSSSRKSEGSRSILVTAVSGRSPRPSRARGSSRSPRPRPGSARAARARRG